MFWKSEASQTTFRQRYAALLQAWPVAAEQLRLPTRWGETFVVACGPAAAPPVLLLHGSMTNAASWMGDVPVLAQHFRVYVLDILGEPGFSAAVRLPLRGDDHAAWLAEVLDGLNVNRAAVVGMSLGGYLALDFAAHHPDRVAALALLCPAGLGRAKPFLLWAVPLLLLGQHKLVRRLFGWRALPADATPRLQAMMDLMAFVQAHFRGRLESPQPLSDTALARLTMPLLVVLGGRDALLRSAETRARLQTRPNVEICWLEREGHLLVRQGARIGAFLQTVLLPHAP